ncbi:MAG: hypothetical protein IKN39_02985 [Clostridia bacterium]|nr:hypothetical protein [Clostridia bacterium]
MSEAGILSYFNERRRERTAKQPIVGRFVLIECKPIPNTLFDVYEYTAKYPLCQVYL